jgi:hypothetical protein
MRDMAARISVVNARRGAIPKFDSDPDFRSSYGSKRLISTVVTWRALRLLSESSGSESNFVAPAKRYRGLRCVLRMNSNPTPIFCDIRVGLTDPESGFGPRYPKSPATSPRAESREFYRVKRPPAGGHPPASHGRRSATPSADPESATGGSACRSPRRSRCTAPAEPVAGPARQHRPAACRNHRARYEPGSDAAPRACV